MEKERSIRDEDRHRVGVRSGGPDPVRWFQVVEVQLLKEGQVVMNLIRGGAEHLVLTLTKRLLLKRIKSEHPPDEGGA